MREIEFRMWNPHGPHFHYGGMALECLIQQNSGRYDHIGEYGAAFEQCTGLKDKNGKEIYEGDIVKFVSSISAYRFIPRDEKRVAVIYDDATFKADGLPLCTCYDVLEVIGNIHENPELLKC